MSKFDKALFFAEYGRKEIGRLFRYVESEIDFICYPLAKTDDEFEKYSKIANEPLSIEYKAIYIHQPFILDGLSQWSYEEERDYLVNIAKKLKDYGYTLTIQLHPRSKWDDYQQLYKNTGINLMMGMEREKFKEYSLVVGHYSTALLYPIFFRIPVMLIDYPGVCKADSSVFYPISCSLPINNVEALTEKYKDFCREYIGTGKCSFENISRIISETIVKLR